MDAIQDSQAEIDTMDISLIKEQGTGTKLTASIKAELDRVNLELQQFGVTIAGFVKESTQIKELLQTSQQAYENLAGAANSVKQYLQDMRDDCNKKTEALNKLRRRYAEKTKKMTRDTKAQLQDAENIKESQAESSSPNFKKAIASSAEEDKEAHPVDADDMLMD